MVSAQTLHATSLPRARTGGRESWRGSRSASSFVRIISTTSGLCCAATAGLVTRGTTESLTTGAIVRLDAVDDPSLHRRLGAEEMRRSLVSRPRLELGTP